MLRTLLKKLNKVRVLFWLLLMGFGIAALALQVQSKLKEAAANVASLAQTEEIRYPVTLTAVTPSTWESWRSYYGQAKAARTQDVTSYVREVVQDVHVQVGDMVKAGDVVVTLLKADYAVKAQASRTSYAEARMNYNRLLELSKKGGVAHSEVDRAYTVMKNEEANAQASRSTLQRTDLKSSIDGVVAARSVEPGEVAEVGRSLVSIVDPSDMEAQLMVSKKDIHNITRNTSVELMVDEATSKGWVKRLSPEAQVGSGLYPVVVGLSPDSGILPGTYLEGRFLVEKKEDVVIISSDVVMYRGDKEFVYVAKDGKASMVEIKTGEGRGGRVIVTSGLRNGDRLVVSGNRALFHGAFISESVGKTDISETGAAGKR
ncbi:MAG: efflux RND transporter periplasmic adaptor subunit [Synergistaceae bacterium]|jgi:membrane fusion protein (multidrug efflux system)|nr:efflux RND transporter periplasmic adaptor subunit [Synergistaceae bacterium]